jgi:rhodanese-related sulfurtransferase
MLSQLFGPSIPNLDPRSLRETIDSGNKPYLLDVREPEEYRDGHIAGATLIPLGQLTQRLAEIPRDRKIICVCHSGNRSGVATRYLVSAGYDAVNLRGGMIGWEGNGFSVKRGIAK